LFPVIQARNSTIAGYTIVDGGSNNECLRQVQHGEADLSHAAITKTPNRELIVNFGAAWFFSGFRILARSQNNFWETMVNIIETLGTAVLLYIAVAVILSVAGGLIFMYSEVLKPGPIDPWDMKSRCSSFSGAASATYGMLQNAAIIEPFGAISRNVALVFKTFGIVLTPILTALITVVLLLNSSSNMINNFDDLNGRTVIVPEATTAQTYMRIHGAGITQIVVPTISDALESFKNGNGDAVVYDWPVLQSFMMNQEQETGGSDYVVVGSVFEEQQYGIAVDPRNPALLEDVNHAVLDSWESDNYNTLEDRWFGTDAITVTQQVNNANDKLYALLFLASAVLLISSVFAIVAEILIASSKVTRIDRGDDHNKSVNALGNTIKVTLSRQEKYATKLPPNALIFATWELVASIGDFLKEWRAPNSQQRQQQRQQQEQKLYGGV
jgi:ABC-type amino acid transport substrate-binding protein